MSSGLWTFYKRGWTDIWPNRGQERIDHSLAALKDKPCIETKGFNTSLGSRRLSTTQEFPSTHSMSWQHQCWIPSLWKDLWILQSVLKRVRLNYLIMILIQYCLSTENWNLFHNETDSAYLKRIKKGCGAIYWSHTYLPPVYSDFCTFCCGLFHNSMCFANVSVIISNVHQVNSITT